MISSSVHCASGLLGHSALATLSSSRTATIVWAAKVCGLLRRASPILRIAASAAASVLLLMMSVLSRPVTPSPGGARSDRPAHRADAPERRSRYGVIRRTVQAAIQPRLAVPPVSLADNPSPPGGPAPGQRRPLVVSGAPRLRSSSGSLAMLTAMRRASSRVSSLAAARWHEDRSLARTRVHLDQANGRDRPLKVPSPVRGGSEIAHHGRFFERVSSPYAGVHRSRSLAGRRREECAQRHSLGFASRRARRALTQECPRVDAKPSCPWPQKDQQIPPSRDHPQATSNHRNLKVLSSNVHESHHR